MITLGGVLSSISRIIRIFEGTAQGTITTIGLIHSGTAYIKREHSKNVKAGINVAETAYITRKRTSVVGVA